MKKKLLLGLSLLLTAILLCVGIVTAVAEEAEPTLSIDKKNLSFSDKVYLLFAVDLQGASPTGDFGMLYWTEPQTSYEKGSEELSVKTAGTQVISGKTYYVFNYEEFAAKNMADEVFARAYVTVDGTTYYSDVTKYSILEYAYTKLGKIGDAPTTNENLKTLLTEMLSYGAAAQKYFNYNTGRLVDANFYQVSVMGGTLANGFTSGLYLAGDTITMTAPETDATGKNFICWTNAAGANVSEDASYTVKVTTSNEVYTATYGESIASAEDVLIFTELSDGTYSVAANPDAEMPTAIAIPDTYNGKSVTAIGDKAFADVTALTSISIPNTVKTIGTRAFYGCTGITEITIPASVTSIGTQIFYKASNLATVYYNSTYSNSDNPIFATNSIEKIVFSGSSVPSSILNGNGNVKTVEITNSVTSIGDWAFGDCTSLTSVTIPDSVTSIDYCAFYGCTSLTSVTIPDSVTRIGDSAFNGCSSLTSVVIGDSVTSIGGGAFYGCTSLTSVTIPDSVTSIGDWAFRDCTSLTSVTIPDSVTSIDWYAFRGCTSLTSVYITDLEAWYKISFYDYESNPMFNGAKLYLNNVLVTEIEIPDSVTTIKDYVFNGCTSLTSVTIPDSVTSIDSYAFYGCTSLTSVTIPDSVTSIGSSAFSRCTSLTSVTIPDSVTSIGYDAFSGCTSLTSVTIPDSVTSIGDSAFNGCTSLTSVVIGDSVTSIGNSAFNACYKLVEVYNLSSSLTVTKGSGDNGYIGYYALDVYTSADAVSKLWTDEDGYQFYEDGDTCYLLGYTGAETELTLPANCNGKPYDIYQRAFSSCDSLASVVIGDNVTSIGYEAFSSCDSLTSVVIGDNVTSIGELAFCWCDSLTSVVIGDSVTSIGKQAFYLCDSLTSVVIGDSVTRIDHLAFYNCTSLTTVYYGGTGADWYAKITIGSSNSNLTSATRYYYSETAPTTAGNYWHYVDGVPTKW